MKTTEEDTELIDKLKKENAELKEQLEIKKLKLLELEAQLEDYKMPELRPDLKSKIRKLKWSKQ